MEAQSTLGEITHELAGIADTLGLTALARRIEEDSRRRLERATLRVVVLGEIKHGKSSLINAMLGGKKVLPTGVTPTTGTAAVVTLGERDGYWLIDEAGERDELEADRFRKLARGKEPLPSSLALVATCTGDAVPEGMELVDTPGINDIDQVRGHSSRQELPRGDVLLFVLDATQALNRTEMGYLRDAVIAVGDPNGKDGTLSNSGATILIALNRIDLIPESERELVRDHVRRELATLMPGGIEVFETDARSGKKQPDPESYGAREVIRLRERVLELFHQRRALLPRRARVSLLRYSNLLTYNASIQGRALGLELEALKAEREEVAESLKQHRLDFEALRDQIAETKAAIIKESKERLEAFRQELEAASFAQLERGDLRVIADVIPGAIRDSIMDFAYAESGRVRHALDALSRHVLRTHGALATRRLQAAALRFGFRGSDVHMQPPSLMVEAGMLTVGMIGTAIMYFGNFIAGMLVTIAGPLATMALRERSVRELRRAAEARIPAALTTSMTGLEQTLVRVVNQHVGGLEEHLVLANAELGQQLSALLDRAGDVISRRSASAAGAGEGHYRATPQGDEQSVELTREALARVELRLGELAARLEALPTPELPAVDPDPNPDPDPDPDPADGAAQAAGDS